MSLDAQCALCGQVVGMIDLFSSLFHSLPEVFALQKNKLAVKHLGKYSMVSYCKLINFCRGYTLIIS